MGCTTKEVMITNAIKVWFYDDEVKNMCTKLEKSFSKLIQEVTSANERCTSFYYRYYSVYIQE